MLVYRKEVKVRVIQPYHRPEGLAARAKVPEFLCLKDDIEVRGIQEPLLCIQFPGWIRVEVGEQRWLAAQELGIKKVNIFIRGNVEVQDGDVRMASVEEVFPFFQDKECDTVRTIRRYAEGGVIKL